MPTVAHISFSSEQCLKFGSLPLPTPSLEGLSTLLTSSTQNAKVYFESLPKPLLEVQIGVQRLVLRAP